jgi:hypothetical protein
MSALSDIPTGEDNEFNLWPETFERNCILMRRVAIVFKTVEYLTCVCSFNGKCLNENASCVQPAFVMSQTAPSLGVISAV